MDERDDDSDPIDAHFDAVDARVEHLCETTLSARLQALEADRRKVRRAFTHGVVVLVAPIVLFMLADEFGGMLAEAAGDNGPLRWIAGNLALVSVGLFVLAMVYVALVLAAPGAAIYLNYRERFKRELVTEIFRAVFPSGTYQPNYQVAKAVFLSSGIWTGDYPELGLDSREARFKGDDLIRGRVGFTEFEASELTAIGTLTIQRRRRRQEITRRPNATLFSGLFFHIGLDRHLRGHTIVEPEATDGRRSDHRSGFQQIDLGDELFAETFRVYTTDPAEAAQLLNPRVRERLLKLTDYLALAPFVSFVGHHLFVAFHRGVPLMEPTVGRQTSYATLSAIGEYFALPELLVRELAVPATATDTSASMAAASTPAILAQPANPGIAARVAESSAIADAHSAEGHVFTAESITRLAMPAADERDLALRPPPESRVRLSPMTSEGLTVSFGLESSFVVRCLWTLALTPFVVGGAARLAGEAGASTLALLAAEVPGVTLAAEQAAAWPVAFVLIAVVFYVLPTYGLFRFPRGLHIGREGVTVRRRLWPIAGRYPLDRFASVRITDKQVALERRNASLLRRYLFPAPPMSTPEDARWLAAHVRRAMMTFGGLRAER
jgi:hypothetical protein